MPRKRMNLVGQKFYRLEVIDFADDYIALNGVHSAKWKCKCECGNEVIVEGRHLKNGHTKSCGCLQKEIVSSNSKTHGMDGTRLHTIWRSMVSRCNTKSSGSYKNYGDRGVRVCSEWLDDFMNFYDWAMENGYRDDLFLERKDNNGNYEPENCAWITYKEQQRNKRNNHFLTYNGETKTMAEWSELLGISYQTLSYRINIAHWDVVRAFETPIKYVGQKKL